MDVEKPAAEGEASDDGALHGQFTWVIEGFGKLKQTKLYSPVFQSGQYNWRILLFPGGNNVQQLSVYLDVADAPSLPQGWSRQAHFSLTVLNHKDTTKNVIKDADHNFNVRAQDWGFREFVQLADLKDARTGFLNDDKLSILARVRVEPQVNWWNWDSKKETGYVGLKNQGATCYMNSLLQTLMHIPYFCKARRRRRPTPDAAAAAAPSIPPTSPRPVPLQAVYHMQSTQEENPEESIPLALQRIFYKLQYSDTSVSTKQLTKSFGWDTYDTFMQHDVQELNRVLVDKLEEKMKGTSVEGTMAHLFRGKFTNYVKCIEVEDVSLRDEDFYDLQMPVKGCKDLYASFDEYVKEEVLDGDNQYQSERFGKQDAKKGVQFKVLPPVLELHLRRFEYDFATDAMAKINERFEFPTTLDLDRDGRKYLTDDADTSIVNVYRLHSVLVHSGGPNGGHYYAFIRPLGSNDWFRFDDERVTKAKEKEATEGQFGGHEHQTPPGHTPQWKFPKISNAYMLVYIRESSIPEINVELTQDDVALHVRRQLEIESGGEGAEEEGAPGGAPVHGGPPRHPPRPHAADWVRALLRPRDAREVRQHPHPEGEEPQVPQAGDLEAHRRAPLAAAALAVGEAAERHLPPRQAPPARVRRRLSSAHPLFSAPPSSPSPLTPVLPNRRYEDEIAMMDVKEDNAPQAGKFQAELRLYLEVIGARAGAAGRPGPDEEAAWPQMGEDEMLLFFKFYDATAEKLSFVGTHIAKKSHRLADLLPVLRATKGLPADQQLAVYEEVEYDASVRFEPLLEGRTLKEAELQSGDIIVFQTLPSAAPPPPADAAGASRRRR